MAMRTETQLSRLMNWLTPSFPVGSYAYSGGLEYAVAEKLVVDRDSLTEWIETQIAAGTGWLDAVLLHLSYAAILDAEDREFIRAAEMADAMRTTSESVLENRAQGKAFLDGIVRAWPHPELSRWVDLLRTEEREPAYPIAVAIAAAVHGIAEPNVVHGYLHAVSTNMISAGMRLIPLGQTEGQATIAILERSVGGVADRALQATFDDLHTSAPIVEWASMQHETQYTRLFRT
jgi:urease accessory protein